MEGKRIDGRKEVRQKEGGMVEEGWKGQGKSKGRKKNRCLGQFQYKGRKKERWKAEGRKE